MTKGIAKVNHHARAGIISYPEAGDYDFIYGTSLVKDAKWNIGDRFVMGDGRVWRYSKSGSALNGGFGAAIWRPTTFDGGTYGATAVGDRSVKITLDAGAITNFGSDIGEDGLRGGYFIQPDTGTPNFRGIIGNTAGGDGDVITLYLDGPITRAMVTTSWCEVIASPYGDLRGTGGAGAGAAGSDYISFAGVPSTTIAAALTYFWVQTAGPVWCTPHLPVADEAYRRDVFFRQDGAIVSASDAAIEEGYQRAGFVMDRTSSGGDNAPWVMLQVSH